LTFPGAVFHGGDVWSIAAECGIEVQLLLDFSANINPRGLPRRALLQLQHDAGDISLLTRYPDPSNLELRAALAGRLGVSPHCVLVGEGAEALIGLVIRAVHPVRCLVPIPAFGEYARACSAAAVDIATIQLDPNCDFSLDRSAYVRMLHDGCCDCVILNNPHNPSGALQDSESMIDLLERARASGAFALVDEAFIDYAPNASIVRYAAEHAHIVVLRSLTKFYGCPALRVGYLVGSPDTVAQVGAVGPTWPVTILAANALREAIQDEEYAQATLRENECARSSLTMLLADLGVRVFPSTANFLLLRLRDGWPDSRQIRDILIHKHHIVVRNCDSYEGLEIGRYIRVALRTAADNARLVEGLRTVLT
jgi:threonine-phosphate decarboxylase